MKENITVLAKVENHMDTTKDSAPKSIDGIELGWRVHLKPFFGEF